MPTPEVHLACARPGHWTVSHWRELERSLDAGEQAAARRFRFDADRAAYVVAHSLLRALVARVSGLPAKEIALHHDAEGRPLVTGAPDLHVSLSRSRDAVACVVARHAAAGVDVERIDAKPADAGLLGEYVMTPEPVTASHFFHQWTALEAFWKARGTGLSDGNPRVHFAPRTASRFDIHLEGHAGCAGHGAWVHAYDDCALAVVLCAPAAADFVLKRTHCASASDIEQLGKVRPAHEPFLERHFDQ